MDAIILAAGLGTRLRPHTLKTPKPLLPVRGRPILDWTLGALPRAVDRVSWSSTTWPTRSKPICGRSTTSPTGRPSSSRSRAAPATPCVRAATTCVPTVPRAQRRRPVRGRGPGGDWPAARPGSGPRRSRSRAASASPSCAPDGTLDRLVEKPAARRPPTGEHGGIPVPEGSFRH